MPAADVDVLVIGGGIHGAGVAQAAAAAGYSVLLLERNTFASGTSSRSSKLIHGGLRYLESAQFGLVRECLQERDLLLRLAPDLVQLCDFHIPVYKTTRRRPWQLRVGLGLYALLAGGAAAARFNTIPRAQWQQLDGLDTGNLQAVFRYRDAQTDDALLTRAVLQSACDLGARGEEHADVLQVCVEPDRCLVSWRRQDQTTTASATVVVNAAGPWINHMLERVTPSISARPVELVQGTHIIVPEVCARGAWYLESPSDGRAVFALPWHGQLLIGTTETAFSGDPASVQPLAAEIRYLLEAVRHYFPERKHLTENDLTGAFAGLRVLPRGEGAAFSRSRETLLQVDNAAQPRVLSIYGGKLTSYRRTAAAVVARLAASLPRRKAVAVTAELPLAKPDVP